MSEFKRTQLLTAIFVCVSLLLSGCTQLLVVAHGNRIADQNHGKRTFGALIEDHNIKRKSLINIKNLAPELKASHIKITSYNGTVLIAGQTDSKKSKLKAKDIVQKIRHVNRVYNAMEIAGPSSLLVRLNDSWITFKVKLALTSGKNTPSNRIKIVTENSTIYLMGLLNRKEESAIIEKIRGIRGVQKIIKLTEYIRG
ncbi:MAG: BON domain-containing protein [Gammaproteobacteria bacterium]|nr:BON domain-containing protein [Gammaproteobacteria bacterium]